MLPKGKREKHQEGQMHLYRWPPLAPLHPLSSVLSSAKTSAFTKVLRETRRGKEMSVRLPGTLRPPSK